MTKFQSELSYGEANQRRSTKLTILITIIFTILGEILLMFLIWPINWIILLIYFPIFIFFGLIISLLIIDKTIDLPPKFFINMNTENQEITITYASPISDEIYLTSFEFSEIWLTFLKMNGKINPEHMLIVFRYDEKVVSIYISTFNFPKDKNLPSFKETVIKLQDLDVFNAEMSEFVNSDKPNLFENLDEVYQYNGDTIFKFEQYRFPVYLEQLGKYMSNQSILSRFLAMDKNRYEEIKIEVGAEELETLPRSKKLVENTIETIYSNTQLYPHS